MALSEVCVWTVSWSAESPQALLRCLEPPPFLLASLPSPLGPAHLPVLPVCLQRRSWRQPRRCLPSSRWAARAKLQLPVLAWNSRRLEGTWPLVGSPATLTRTLSQAASPGVTAGAPPQLQWATACSKAVIWARICCLFDSLIENIYF